MPVISGEPFDITRGHTLFHDGLNPITTGGHEGVGTFFAYHRVHLFRQGLLNQRLCFAHAVISVVW